MAVAFKDIKQNVLDGRIAIFTTNETIDDNTLFHKHYCDECYISDSFKKRAYELNAKIGLFQKEDGTWESRR